MTDYCSCDKFTESPNPREFGCVKCGRLPEPPVLDSTVVADYFDGLREMLEAAGRIQRPDPIGQTDPQFEWFKSQAIARLNQGAKTYGPNRFMKPDVKLPQEAIEEMLDISNYGLMELTKSTPDDTDAALLGQAIYHTFCAYQAVANYAATRSRR